MKLLISRAAEELFFGLELRTSSVFTASCLQVVDEASVSSEAPCFFAFFLCFTSVDIFNLDFPTLDFAFELISGDQQKGEKKRTIPDVFV